MKKLFAFILGILLVGALFAQTFTSTSHFWRFQCDPQFDAAGHVTAASVQAFYKTTVSDGATSFDGPVQTVSWDAIATGNQTVTLPSGTTVTRAEVLQAVMIIAQQVKDTPPPVPVADVAASEATAAP